MPLYRMEKQFTRMGVPMARSTLCALFHQAANILEPIYRTMKLLVEASILVLADETKIPVLDEKLNKTRQGYMVRHLSMCWGKVLGLYWSMAIQATMWSLPQKVETEVVAGHMSEESFSIQSKQLPIKPNIYWLKS